MQPRSFPVSYMVRTIVSKDIFLVFVRKLASDTAFMERIAATAFLSMQGICTRPFTGSQVSPSMCSMDISAAYSICSMLMPRSSARPAEAMQHAVPTSAWQPHSAPDIEAFVFTIFPMSPAVARAFMICSSSVPSLCWW